MNGHAVTLDIERAELVLEHVLAHRNQHSQSAYGYRDPSDPECGTVACLAGWTVLLFSPVGDVTWDPDGYLHGVLIPGTVRRGDPSIAAQRLLGLTSVEAITLFWDMDEDRAIGRLQQLIDDARAALVTS